MTFCNSLNKQIISLCTQLFPLLTRYLRLADDTFSSPKQGPFWSAPEIMASGWVQQWKSTILSFPVKSDKSDWVRRRNDYLGMLRKSNLTRSGVSSAGQRIVASGDTSANEEAIQRSAIHNWELCNVIAVLYWKRNGLQFLCFRNKAYFPATWQLTVSTVKSLLMARRRNNRKAIIGTLIVGCLVEVDVRQVAVCNLSLDSLGNWQICDRRYWRSQTVQR